MQMKCPDLLQYTCDTGVLCLQVRGKITVADVDVMQYWVGDVDAALAASGTSTMHVPEDVGEASELTVATDTPAGLHPAVASAVH